VFDRSHNGQSSTQYGAGTLYDFGGNSVKFTWPGGTKRSNITLWGYNTKLRWTSSFSAPPEKASNWSRMRCGSRSTVTRLLPSFYPDIDPDGAPARQTRGDGAPARICFGVAGYVGGEEMWSLGREKEGV
jgi:hypothetical protein